MPYPIGTMNTHDPKYQAALEAGYYYTKPARAARLRVVKVWHKYPGESPRLVGLAKDVRQARKMIVEHFGLHRYRVEASQ